MVNLEALKNNQDDVVKLAVADEMIKKCIKFKNFICFEELNSEY